MSGYIRLLQSLLAKGAFLLFMMMAANFQNALNDYGIRSNAFMTWVIASGSNGSGSGTDDSGKWAAEYPPCGWIWKYIFVGFDSNGLPEWGDVY